MKPWWNSETHQKRTGIYIKPPWALGPLGPWVRERLWLFIEAAIYRISRISRFSATVHARAVGTSRDKPSEPAAGDVEVHGPRIVLHDKPRFPDVPITFRCFASLNCIQENQPSTSFWIIELSKEIAGACGETAGPEMFFPTAIISIRNLVETTNIEKTILPQFAEY